ncbi:TniB family NTP-binding protein [Marinobacter manganoxydans]|uniref:TniB n=1 Tax=Marinobacter manganoxydans MnI7-9 TaxID=1094979 RepID=G6YV07_9GAMM|nr:TniB family NTP-binding protein [Marinobacter manganoxydans]EHJ03941.1 TniB [Marinobacter manganoxydans MnI7-9]
MVAAEGRKLDEEALKMLDQGNASRIAYIKQDRWIGYPAATRIAQGLNDLITHPTSSRMPSMAIVGRPNNGKTTLVRRFISMHPSQNTENGIRTPIVLTYMPASSDEPKFWTSLLTQLMVVHRPAASARALQNQAERVLREMGVRVLIIDEFHHLASAPLRQQENVLAALKNLSSSLSLSLVLVGTQALLGALRADDQLATRLTPYVLERWEANQNYQKLLFKFEKQLPLQNPSNLADPKLANEIFSRSMQTIGGTKSVVIEAAIKAIESDTEVITPDIVRSVDVVTHHDFGKLMKKI